MSSHRESGDEAHVHDEAEETVVAQAGEGELGETDPEQTAGGLESLSLNFEELKPRPRPLMITTSNVDVT